MNTCVSDEDGRTFDAASLKRLREHQERQRAEGASVDACLIVAGEFMELVEATTDEAQLHELLDIAGAALRQASRLQRDIDAREGGAT